MHNTGSHKHDKDRILLSDVHTLVVTLLKLQRHALDVTKLVRKEARERADNSRLAYKVLHAWSQYMSKCSTSRRLITRAIGHERTVAVQELRQLARSKVINIEVRRTRVRKVDMEVSRLLTSCRAKHALRLSADFGGWICAYVFWTWLSRVAVSYTHLRAHETS